MERPDFFRSLSLRIDNSLGDADVEVPVELCPDARMYGIELSADNGATFQTQDSEMVLQAEDCVLHFDLPGLVLPAFARLQARAASIVRLTIVYGHCGDR